MTNLKQKYYVRVMQSNAPAFEEHLKIFNVDFTQLSIDFVDHQGATALYAVYMDSQSALSLKLSFPLVGCMNFEKTMNKQVTGHLTNPL